MQLASRIFTSVFARALALAAVLSPIATFAAVTEWKPDKRVEIVIPSGSGGGNDRIVRVIQKAVQERKLADAVMTITHKPGAGRVVGLAYLNQLQPGTQTYLNAQYEELRALLVGLGLAK